MPKKQSPLQRYRGDRSLKSVAEEFKVNRSTILRWETGDVPVERVHEIERVTGISRHDLRPDIFGPAPASAA